LARVVRGVAQGDVDALGDAERFHFLHERFLGGRGRGWGMPARRMVSKE
jgi:hypothetical protein